MNPAVLVALIGALIAPILTYIVAVRKLSGKIATSEAKDLWTESSRMREEYRAQIGSLTERCRRLEDQVIDLVGSGGSMRETIERQSEYITELQNKIVKLEEENVNLKKEIIRLEGLLDNRNGS